ncbi:hypothetical protein GGX14DRAFT_557466 [Mycena pura]|uniref:Uncharacterized protein n=1 Tax=Mycena pura TaxID=153505 RepID=A0AAD6YNN3_9AGAR|nr:hypothetical protein GGX14DRAFT_557466 [Mycena pura]
MSRLPGFLSTRVCNIQVEIWGSLCSHDDRNRHFYTSVLPLPPRAPPSLSRGSLSSSTRFASFFGSHNTKHPQQAPQAQQASPSASLHEAIPSDQPLDVPACTAPACRAAPWFPFAPVGQRRVHDQQCNGCRDSPARSFKTRARCTGQVQRRTIIQNPGTCHQRRLRVPGSPILVCLRAHLPQRTYTNRMHSGRWIESVQSGRVRPITAFVRHLSLPHPPARAPLGLNDRIMVVLPTGPANARTAYHTCFPPPAPPLHAYALM